MRDLSVLSKCTIIGPDEHVMCVIGVFDTEEQGTILGPHFISQGKKGLHILSLKNVGCSHVARTSSIYVIHITALLFSLKQ